MTKPRIIELLLVTTVPTMVLANDGWPSIGLMLATVLGGALAAGGANAINMYVDRDIDVLMGRTGRRPIPSGRIPGWHAIVLGVVLMVAATLILWLAANWLTAKHG